MEVLKPNGTKHQLKTIIDANNAYGEKKPIDFFNVSECLIFDDIKPRQNIPSADYSEKLQQFINKQETEEYSQYKKKIVSIGDNIILFSQTITNAVLTLLNHPDTIRVFYECYKNMYPKEYGISNSDVDKVDNRDIYFDSFTGEFYFNFITAYVCKPREFFTRKELEEFFIFPDNAWFYPGHFEANIVANNVEYMLHNMGYKAKVTPPETSLVNDFKFNVKVYFDIDSIVYEARKKLVVNDGCEDKINYYEGIKGDLISNYRLGFVQQVMNYIEEKLKLDDSVEE